MFGQKKHFLMRSNVHVTGLSVNGLSCVPFSISVSKAFGTTLAGFGCVFFVFNTYKATRLHRNDVKILLNCDHVSMLLVCVFSKYSGRLAALSLSLW